MSETATIVGHVVIFLTTVAGFVFQWAREERSHRWQQEQRRWQEEQFSQTRTDIRNGKDTHS